MSKQNGIFGKHYSSPEIEIATMISDIMLTSGGDGFAAVEWDSEQWDGQGGNG